MNEQLNERKLVTFNPAIAGAAAVGAVALIEIPAFAQAADPAATISNQVSGLSGIATAAAAVAGTPIVIYFGYRILKKILSGGT